jgi:hypothetical protein
MIPWLSQMASTLVLDEWNFNNNCAMMVTAVIPFSSPHPDDTCGACLFSLFNVINVARRENPSVSSFSIFKWYITSTEQYIVLPFDAIDEGQTIVLWEINSST